MADDLSRGDGGGETRFASEAEILGMGSYASRREKEGDAILENHDMIVRFSDFQLRWRIMGSESMMKRKHVLLSIFQEYLSVCRVGRRGHRHRQHSYRERSTC